MTKDDLREIKEYGWLHQVAFGVGAFFFSGAFWQLIDLFSHQEKFAITSWVITYFISMGFGAVCCFIGLRIFNLKQRRLEKYFPDED